MLHAEPHVSLSPPEKRTDDHRLRGSRRLRRDGEVVGVGINGGGEGCGLGGRGGGRSGVLNVDVVSEGSAETFLGDSGGSG